MDVLLNDTEREIRSAARTFLESQCPTTLVRAMENKPLGYSITRWNSMTERGLASSHFGSIAFRSRRRKPSQRVKEGGYSVRGGVS